jgi:hypothetical protein
LPSKFSKTTIAGPGLPKANVMQEKQVELDKERSTA